MTAGSRDRTADSQAKPTGNGLLVSVSPFAHEAVGFLASLPPLECLRTADTARAGSWPYTATLSLLPAPDPALFTPVASASCLLLKSRPEALTFQQPHITCN